MPEATPVAQNPQLTRPGSVWSNDNTIYGLISADGSSNGKGPGEVQLVVAPIGGKPSFYQADATKYDTKTGGVIKTGLGPIQAVGGMMPQTTLNKNGDVLELTAGGAGMQQNLQRMLSSVKPALAPQ